MKRMLRLGSCRCLRVIQMRLTDAARSRMRNVVRSPGIFICGWLGTAKFVLQRLKPLAFGVINVVAEATTYKDFQVVTLQLRAR
jgi:hypothetical protein